MITKNRSELRNAARIFENLFYRIKKIMKRINQMYWIDYDAIKKYDDKQDGIHCVMCGKILTGRRKKYCSWDCELDYQIIKYKWKSQNQNRRDVFKRDNNICKTCNKQFPNNQLIADHIIPIALGGEEFELNNIQTLCLDCNKIKTAQDMKVITEYHRKEKILEKNQTLEIR